MRNLRTSVVLKPADQTRIESIRRYLNTRGLASSQVDCIRYGLSLAAGEAARAERAERREDPR